MAEPNFHSQGGEVQGDVRQLAKCAADSLTGFWRELVVKIDDLLDDLLFESCRISSFSDFGMRTTDVNGNVLRIIELAAHVALYGSRHLAPTKSKHDPIPHWIRRMGARVGYAFL